MRAAMLPIFSTGGAVLTVGFGKALFSGGPNSPNFPKDSPN